MSSRRPLIKRLLLDVLKPREIPTIEVSKKICEIDGISHVTVVVTEVDARTETLKVTVKGDDVCYEKVASILQEGGCVVRSVDEVEVGVQ
ncbi:MAG: DUF211 domain-containing protein [Candidatus Methanodesulfokora sp.]|jgi:hypothetical protein|nr:MAG: hypothetical protein C0200_04445 [Candidatus Korarchaeota archaeon]